MEQQLKNNKTTTKETSKAMKKFTINFQQFNDCEPRCDHICRDYPHHRHHRWIPGDPDQEDDDNDHHDQMNVTCGDVMKLQYCTHTDQE